MLVVTRKVGERIMIGDKVVVTVVRISGNIVRVGVEAPADCAVVRRELVDRNHDRPAARSGEAAAGKSSSAEPSASVNSPESVVAPETANPQ